MLTMSGSTSPLNELCAHCSCSSSSPCSSFHTSGSFHHGDYDDHDHDHAFHNRYEYDHDEGAFHHHQDNNCDHDHGRPGNLYY